MKIKVIGLATQKSEASNNWSRGMRNTGIKHKLLGLGKEFTGWEMRSELYLEEMEADTDTDIFITSDIYDVLINKDVVKKIKKAGQKVKDHVLDTFQGFEKPIVVGAEIPCFSHNCYDFNFQDLSNLVEGDYRSPNAGLIMGYRQNMIELYRELKNHKNDQMHLGKLMNTYPELFALDTESKLFYNVYVYSKEDRLENSIFVHFPGMKYIVSSAVAYNDFQAQGYQPLDIPKIAMFSVLGFLVVISIVIYLLYRFYWRLKPGTRASINYPSQM